MRVCSECNGEFPNSGPKTVVRCPTCRGKCDGCGKPKDDKRRGARYCLACAEKCLECGGKKARTQSGKSFGRCLACHARKEAARRDDPAYVRDNQIKIKARLYGVTYEEAERGHDATECEACGGPANARRLHFDHDHATGKFRGILCQGCNVALGGVDDDVERLQALVRYLESRR